MNRKIAALGIMIAGVLLVRSVMGGGFSLMNNADGKKTYTCANKVKSIHIQEITGEIVVQKGNVGRVTVSYSERDGRHDYEISESDGKFSIVRKKRIQLFDIDFLKRCMTVTVPDDLEGELDISNTSGSIQIAGLAAKQVAIDNVSGNITLEAASSESDLKVKNTTGTITLTDVAAEGNVDVDNTTGKILVENLKSEGNTSLKTVTGSIKGTIAGKESDYRISSKVVTGKNSLNNSGSGTRKLTVSTTTGSIDLSFTKQP